MTTLSRHYVAPAPSHRRPRWLTAQARVALAVIAVGLLVTGAGWIAGHIPVLVAGALICFVWLLALLGTALLQGEEAQRAAQDAAVELADCGHPSLVRELRWVNHETVCRSCARTHRLELIRGLRGPKDAA